MAVANVAKAGDGTTTTSSVVTVDDAVGSITIMDTGVLLNANDILEVDSGEDMYAGIGHLLAPEELTQGCAGAPEHYLVIGDAVLGQHNEDIFPGGLSGHALNRTLVQVNGNLVPGAFVDELSQVDLAHHGRHDMGVLEVEVVVGTIEVGGHDSDIVGAILQVVALAHLQACNLGNGVRLIGILQWSGEQGILSHGLWSLLGVDASAAQEEELLHAMGVSLADDVALDLHIHHDEVGTVQAVGHDTAYEGCCQHHCIRPLTVEELLHGYLIGQVHLLDGQTHQVVVSPLFQVIPNSRAN